MLCFRCGSYNVDEAKECTVCGQALHDEHSGRGREGKKANGKPAVGSFEVGETVGGKYRIDGVIGQGGVGTVYRATDTEV
ncbi:MAG: hypothetical protein ACO3JL_18935, partial [Myxococcota bacterium]